MNKRNILKDMEAAATWPWLGDMAGLLAEHDTTARGLRSGHAGLALFLIGRWSVGSATQLTSLLGHPGTWGRLRLVATTAGLALPASPPTYDQLRAYRDRVDAADGFLELLEDAKALLTRVGVAQAQQQGLLLPSVPDWDRLDRGNVVAADGSVFKAASRVKVDEDGKVVGSRADLANPRSTGPRIVEQRPGKEGDGSGVPVELVTVRSDDRHTRVVVAVEEILDGNENAAAGRSLERVIRAAAGGVHAVVYDRLLAGADMARLLDLKVMPTVAMKAASEKAPHLVLPARTARKAPAGKRGAAKRRVQLHDLWTAIHRTADGTVCHHEVHAVDGAVVIPPRGQEVKATTVPAPRRALDVIDTGLGRVEWIGTYAYRCDGVEHLHPVDFNGRTSTDKAGTSLMNWVRPLPESDPQFARLDGYRGDVESGWATLKRTMSLDGRASSYHPDHFALDVVGGGLLLNALAWQEHGALVEVAA